MGYEYFSKNLSLQDFVEQCVPDVSSKENVIVPKTIYRDTQIDKVIHFRIIRKTI